MSPPRTHLGQDRPSGRDLASITSPPTPATQAPARRILRRNLGRFRSVILALPLPALLACEAPVRPSEGNDQLEVQRNLSLPLPGPREILHRTNPKDWVGRAHNEMIDGFFQLVLEGGVRAGGICASAARYKVPSTHLPSDLKGLEGSATIRAHQRQAVALSTECGGRGPRGGGLRFTGAGAGWSAVSDSLSVRASELLGHIISEAAGSGSPDSLAATLSAILDTAYAELSVEEADGVAAVAATAQSSAEYWGENLTPLMTEASPWVQANCAEITPEQCMGDYDSGGCGPPDCWETSHRFPGLRSHEMPRIQLAGGFLRPDGDGPQRERVVFPAAQSSCDALLPTTGQLILTDVEAAGVALAYAKATGTLTVQTGLAIVAAGGAASALRGFGSIILYLWCEWHT